MLGNSRPLPQDGQSNFQTDLPTDRMTKGMALLGTPFEEPRPFGYESYKRSLKNRSKNSNLYAISLRLKFHLMGTDLSDLAVMFPPEAVMSLLPCHSASPSAVVLKPGANFSQTFFFGLS